MKKKAVVLLGTIGIMAVFFTGCQNNGNTGGGSQPQTNSANSTSQSDTANNPDMENFISEDEAKQIAFQDAGINEADVVNSRIQLQKDDGVWEYEIDFYVGNQEYDYDLDAKDGTIRSKDQEIDDDFGQTTPGNTTVTEAEAIKTALEKVSGATEQDIRIRLETDDGRSVYEGSIVYNNMEYDFEIDAQTGSIIEWDEDSAFDD